MFFCCSYITLINFVQENGKIDCVDVGMLYEALGKKKLRVLPDFHVFTECDQGDTKKKLLENIC